MLYTQQTLYREKIDNPALNCRKDTFRNCAPLVELITTIQEPFSQTSSAITQSNLRPLLNEPTDSSSYEFNEEENRRNGERIGERFIGFVHYRFEKESNVRVSTYRLFINE